VVFAYAGARQLTENATMPDLAGRDLHLVKKALAIAVLTIERSPDGPFRSDSDMADMKTLLDDMIESDVELAQYTRGAHIALTGRPV
jgi:hypothetical protein